MIVSTLISSIFLSIIVVDTTIDTIQADAEKQMTITTQFTPLPPSSVSLNDNSFPTDQNIVNSVNNNSNSVTNVTNVQQEGGNNTNNVNISSYLTYLDPGNGISMTYPSNWQKVEYPSGAMNYGMGHRIIASFLAPLNPSGPWRTSLNIEISTQSDLKNIIPQNATTTVTNLGDHRGFKLEYTNNQRLYLNRNLTNFNTVTLKTMQVWTSIGNNTYLLTYNAPPSEYSQYLPIIQKMLNSFKVS
jgi:hypothetical protein